MLGHTELTVQILFRLSLKEQQFNQGLYYLLIQLYHLDAYLHSQLQIRGDIEDNSKILFLFLDENVCCDPSLEPSQ